MQKIGFSIFFLLMSLGVFAQKAKSTLRFSLSDNQLLTVTINERDYQKVGTSLVFTDLPKKRHAIRIYKFRPYADGNGGKAELLYVGNIKVEPGKKYDFILDVRTNKLKVKEVRNFETLPTYKGNYIPGQKAPMDPGRDQALRIENASDGLAEQHTDSFELPPDNSANMNDGLIALKNNMQGKVNDQEKLQLAKAYINKEKVTVRQAGLIASWINFDDNKLIFLNNVKSKVVDPENVRQLADELTLKASKDSFLNSL